MISAKNKMKRWEIKNLEGQKIGRLSVLNYFGSRKGAAYWLCKCDCGILKVIGGTALRRGATKSCGCLQKELLRKRRKTHNMSKTNIYSTWIDIKRRCYNSNKRNYSFYGGRGITVCDKWLNSFENFYKDMGDKPKGFTIERIDNNKGYSPDNCKWATVKENNRNKRNNRLIFYEGKTKTIAEWAEIFNLNPRTLRTQLFRNNWSLATVLQKRSIKYRPAKPVRGEMQNFMNFLQLKKY